MSDRRPLYYLPDTKTGFVLTNPANGLVDSSS